MCKPCYAQLKKQRAVAAAVDHTPELTPKPSECRTCGKTYPEVAFKWRADLKQGGWRTACNACYNAKGYHIDSRQRQREADEAAYLARNAATHLAWAHRNKDKVKMQQHKTATLADRKIKSIKTSAMQRGLTFDDNDTTAMQEKLADACFFCGFMPAGDEPLNGLDRVDATIGYTDSNTVACCSTCNSMKGPLHIDEFITNVRAIARHTNCCRDNPDTRCRIKPFAGTANRREAEAVDKDDDGLPYELKTRLWSSECYLCGRGPSFGIDRVDPRKGYIVDNVLPCCSTHCNYMKKDLELSEFKNHIAFIYAHTAVWVLGDIGNIPLTSFGGHVREPVAATSSSGAWRLVFPSIMTAARLIACSANAIRRAVDVGCIYRACIWQRVNREEFEMQRLTVTDANKLLSCLTAAT